MSAAMSFYGILSLASLLVLMVAVLGWWPDRTYIETSLVSQISRVIGEPGVWVVKQAISSAQAPSEGITASLIVFVLLLSAEAGSVVVILMWIYFSSAVLLLSASMARAWCDKAADKPAL